MKKVKTDCAKKVFALCFTAFGFLISVSAQPATLALKNGRATVNKNFSPRKDADAHFYFLKLRRNQTAEIKVLSNTIYLGKENPCGIGFQLFDPKGEEVWLGDQPAWVDDWKLEIKETGNYKIKIYMSCFEGGLSTAQLRKKKLDFKYSLKVQTK